MNSQTDFLQHFFGINFNSRDSGKAKPYFAALSFKKKESLQRKLLIDLIFQKAQFQNGFGQKPPHLKLDFTKHFKSLENQKKIISGYH